MTNFRKVRKTISMLIGQYQSGQLVHLYEVADFVSSLELIIKEIVIIYEKYHSSGDEIEYNIRMFSLWRRFSEFLGDKE